MTKKKRSPAQCTFNQLCKMPRDNFDVGDFNIITDGHTVWLGEQKTGKQPTQRFQIPRAVFNRLIRWYTTEVQLKD